MTHYDKLEEIMSILRSENGCPWDKEQTHKSLKICLLEESAEVLEAIDKEDDLLLLEELGDLLLQVYFHSQIASESNRFSIKDVVEAICEKLVSRHPHVFGSTNCTTAEQVLNQWENIKKIEKANSRKSIFDGIPTHLSSLHRSEKIIKKAIKANFENLLPTPNSDLIEKCMQGKASGNEFATLLTCLVTQAAKQDIHLEDELRSYNNSILATLKASQTHD